ncbi:MAG: PIG-L deacetylase family protein [Bacteroidota bacterium]
MFRKITKKIEAIYKYRYFANNEKAAYSFLVDKIHKSTDIDFVENVWQLDHFREVLQPRPLDLSGLKKVLVLAPHQDDETIGCGGTLLELAQMRCQITVGFLTNGAELSNPSNSVTIRREEAKAVCKDIDAEMLELGIDNIDLSITPSHVKELKSWMEKDWDAIFTIWPVDQPPKHRLCSYLVGRVMASSNFNKPIVFYAVHTDLLPNFYVDITAQIDEKQLLLKKYESQLRAQCYDHLSKGMDAWRSRFLQVSSTPRFIETFMRVGASGYAEFQQLYQKSDTHRLFKGNDACIHSFSVLKKMDID